MSRVQTNPDFFKQIKSLAAQVASLQRIALTTNSAVGDLIPSAAPSRPGGLLCDGTAYSRTEYATLFDAIGTAYGSGDGSTTFNVPDLRGRMPIGAGTGTGARATAWSLGSQPTSGAGGEQTHTLTASESGVPAHSHGVNDSGHAHSVNTTWENTVTTAYAGGSNVYTQTGYANQTTSSNTTNISIQNNTAANASSPHNILPPVSVINWFIIY